MQPTPLLLVACVLAATFVSSCAFKEHDFKKCDSNNFCKRNRGTVSSYSVDPKSLKVEGAELYAVVTNTAAKQSFNFTLRAYGPVIRLIVDELQSDSLPRYQVPDILEPALEERLTAWQQPQSTAKAWTGKVGDVTVQLTFANFKVEVLVGNTPVLVFNSRSLFNMEHPRKKQDGDPEGWWEETFNGHPDSKPSGPEAISFDITFPGYKHVYGIPERATNFSLQPTAGSGVQSEPYRLYNLDVFEYEHYSPFGLYGAIPVMLAHKAGFTVGAFWLNAAEMYVDVEAVKGGDKAVQWISESGILDLFILTGPTPAAVTQQFASLSGTTAMPQLFALGYHQCRWNYKDEPDAYAVDAGFDEHSIPYDVLWLDIEHTNGKRYMTWDAFAFPHPAEMQNDIASRGRKMVTIVDPHVKRDYSYYIHKEASDKKYYVQNKDGAEFDGWCWPGSSSYLDVTSPEVRAWWATQFTPDKYKGSTKHLYIWNDMNEPSVFNGPEITMPKDVLHHGNVEHRDIHNIFGYYYHLATAEGLIHRGQDKELFGEHGDRPFVLSRAFYAGTQRVGPIWTGDNAAQWSHLAVSVPMLLTLNMAGLPFSGADVGGFFGNPDAELLTRWYQLGIYYPFFRGHAHLETQRREPWLFGEDTTRRIREAIRGRYMLLPYIYTLFRHTNQTGVPIMRPLWYEFPNNAELFGVDDEFMLGPGILVKPISHAGASEVDLTLPVGALWYEALAGQSLKVQKPGQLVTTTVSIEAIPVFYKGGAIVPRRDRPRRSTATMAADPFTLVVALDESGKAEGDLYLDDGHSFAFTKGAYLHRRFVFADGHLVNSAAPQPAGTPASKLDSKLLIEKVIILGLAPDKSYTASVGSTSYAVRTGMGVDPRMRKGQGVVVRTVNLPLNGDWSLKISESKGIATE